MTDWLAQLSGEATVGALLAPDHLRDAEGLASVSGKAPRKPGIYAWYFDVIPPGIDASNCHRCGAFALLYCGISPKKPPTNGRPPSRAHLAQRLRTHFGGNAAGSTLRLTLGCLLEAELGIVLRRVGNTGRQTFTNPGEQQLDQWLRAHARVAWAEHPHPWEVEEALLASGLPLPLNIGGNPCAAFAAPLSALRRAARARAMELPLVPDSGGARRSRR